MKYLQRNLYNYLEEVIDTDNIYQYLKENNFVLTEEYTSDEGKKVFSTYWDNRINILFIELNRI